MKLVLAEKPSVAQSIAKVIGATKRCDGYWEGEKYIVSWCVGHLVELASPEMYDEKYRTWTKEDLPILPEVWKYQVSDATKKQFNILKHLMHRNDVESLICATDAGREGELIFRLVYHQCQCKKTFERLWISSMEDVAIEAGFQNLRPSADFDSLYEAALCRERADWIVGINATRLFSCLYGQTLNVGRVMTPTLAMVVFREAEIAAFQQEPFYTVQLVCPGFNANSERFKKIDKANESAALCKQAAFATVVSVDTKEKKEKAPPLYDLTSLQRAANKQLGFTAQQTLDYTQSLYEKKLVTYPRTDSRFLTDDMALILPDLLTTIAAFLNKEGPSRCHIQQVINSAKVADHHAIIPTKEIETYEWKTLPQGELAVLRMIAVRLMMSVSDAYCFEETKAMLLCADISFYVKGKTVLQKGWKNLEETPEDSDDKEEHALPTITVGEKILVERVTIKEGKTTPPKSFTEDMLLQAMERATSKETPTDAEHRGIGTPATRAGIIEKLVKKGYLQRKGEKKTKQLVPTDKGIALITVMPEQIQSPSMTAEWEEKLLKMKCGTYESRLFMNEVEKMIQELVQTCHVVKDAQVFMPKNSAVVGTCPHCGNDVVEREKGWFCYDKHCQFVLWKENVFFNHIGKKLTPKIAITLLCDGRVLLKNCQSKKTGRRYNAAVVLGTDADGRATFHLEFNKKVGKGK